MSYRASSEEPGSAIVRPYVLASQETGHDPIMDERTDPTTDILAAKQALRRGAIVGGAFIRRTTYDRLGQESQDTAAARNDVEAERSGWDDVTPVLGTTAVRPSVGAPEGTLYNGLHRIDPDPTGSLSPDTLRRDAHRQGPIW